MEERRAVILVGHGGVPKDCPRELVTRLKQLEALRRAAGGPPSPEEEAVDRQIRTWPRTDKNDPYRLGLVSLAGRLAPLLGAVPLRVAYNEFCVPSLEEAADQLVAEGFDTVAVVTTMMTPGGSHAELDIPETLSRLSRRHPTVRFDYHFPFDMERVAELFAAQIRNRWQDPETPA